MMAEFPSMPLWTDAYIADTSHLTNEEHGVYLRLMMFAWRTPGCALPADDKRLALMVGVTPKKWAKLKAVIMSFWRENDGVYTNKRLTAERKKVSEVVKRNSAAGKASAKARSLKNHKTAPTTVSTTETTKIPTKSQPPYPYPKEKEPSVSPNFITGENFSVEKHLFESLKTELRAVKFCRKESAEGFLRDWLEAGIPYKTLAMSIAHAKIMRRPFDELSEELAEKCLENNPPPPKKLSRNQVVC